MFWTTLVALLLLVGSGAPLCGQAQPTQRAAKNLVLLELITLDNPLKFDFGRVALHYERFVRSEVGLGVGLAYDNGYACARAFPVAPEACDLTVLRAPVTLNRLWTDGSHRFELGVGVGLGYSAGNNPNAYKTLQGFLYSAAFRIGYRYQPPSGGLTFTATWLPRLFGNDDNLGVAGLGIGFSF